MADSTGLLSSHVALPDGRHAWECAAETTTDLETLVMAAAAQVAPNATLTTLDQYALLPHTGTDSSVVVLLTRHVGGAAISVHVRHGDTFTWLGEGLVTQGSRPDIPAPRDEPDVSSVAHASNDVPVIPPAPTDLLGPNETRPPTGLTEVLNQQALAEALNSNVPPRDAAERMTFATWAIVTGTSPGGIFTTLPQLDDDTVTKIAQRLCERTEGTITDDDVKGAPTIEALATVVREFLEAGELDGFVRTIRAATSDDQVPVYVFHAAGGSTVVYEPLLKRLPAATPMIGFERVEGTIQERAAQYVPKLLALNGGKPFILAGWSLGGALAYACAIGLQRAGAEVTFVAMIDTVHPGEDIPQTREETRARWDRYAGFAARTFNVQIPAIPYEHLEELDDEGQVTFVLDAVNQAGVQIPGGILEHQRTSYLDNRALETVTIEPYDGHVILYMADRYHDDVIEFEPRYAIRQSDGG
jgi:polyketide synthase 13